MPADPRRNRLPANGDRPGPGSARRAPVRVRGSSRNEICDPRPARSCPRRPVPPRSRRAPGTARRRVNRCTCGTPPAPCRALQGRTDGGCRRPLGGTRCRGGPDGSPAYRRSGALPGTATVRRHDTVTARPRRSSPPARRPLRGHLPEKKDDGDAPGDRRGAREPLPPPRLLWAPSCPMSTARRSRTSRPVRKDSLKRGVGGGENCAPVSLRKPRCGSGSRTNRSNRSCM